MSAALEAIHAAKVEAERERAALRHTLTMVQALSVDAMRLVSAYAAKLADAREDRARAPANDVSPRTPKEATDARQ